MSADQKVMTQTDDLKRHNQAEAHTSAPTCHNQPSLH